MSQTQEFGEGWVAHIDFPCPKCKLPAYTYLDGINEDSILRCKECSFSGPLNKEVFRSLKSALEECKKSLDKIYK